MTCSRICQLFASKSKKIRPDKHGDITRKNAVTFQNYALDFEYFPDDPSGENPVNSVDNYEFLTLSTGFSTGCEKQLHIHFS